MPSPLLPFAQSRALLADMIPAMCIQPGITRGASGGQVVHKIDFEKLFDHQHSRHAVGLMVLDHIYTLNGKSLPSPLYLGGPSNGAKRIIEALQEVMPYWTSSPPVEVIPLVVTWQNPRDRTNSPSYVSNLFPHGAKVWMIEDVLTTAGSLLDAAAVLRSYGAIIENSLAFVCRHEIALQNVIAAYILPHFFFKLSDILPQNLHPDVPDLY